MKIKLLLPFASVCLISLILSSCSNKEYFSFSASQPTYTKVKPIPGANLNQNNSGLVSESFLTPKQNMSSAKEEPLFEASAGKAIPVLPEKQPATSSGNTKMSERIAESLPKQENYAEPATLKLINERKASLTQVEKKAFKRDLKKASRGAAPATSNILLIILAFLLPPIAVALFEGITNRFWISLLLTLLFVIPGIIYALLVVTGTI